MEPGHADGRARRAELLAKSHRELREELLCGAPELRRRGKGGEREQPGLELRQARVHQLGQELLEFPRLLLRAQQPVISSCSHVTAVCTKSGARFFLE
jgi:hypothetical protein